MQGSQNDFMTILRASKAKLFVANERTNSFVHVPKSHLLTCDSPAQQQFRIFLIFLLVHNLICSHMSFVIVQTKLQCPNLPVIGYA